MEDKYISRLDVEASLALGTLFDRTDNTVHNFFEMMFPPAPVVNLNITSVYIECQRKLVELNDTVFKWSKSVPKDMRGSIDLYELEDPLELYGKWVTVTKKRMRWVVSGCIQVEEKLLDGDVYVFEGVRFVVDGDRLFIENTNFKTKKEVPVIKTGEAPFYFYASTFKYEPRETENFSHWDDTKIDFVHVGAGGIAGGIGLDHSEFWIPLQSVEEIDKIHVKDILIIDDISFGPEHTSLRFMVNEKNYDSYGVKGRLLHSNHSTGDGYAEGRKLFINRLPD